MKPDDSDARIRAALGEAHRADSARLPPFERVWAAAKRGARPRRRAVLRLVTVGSLATAVVLGALLVRRPGPPPPLPPGSDWRGPTDFLLETPGLVTLRTVPALGPMSSDPLLGPDPDARRGTP